MGNSSGPLDVHCAYSTAIPMAWRARPCTGQVQFTAKPVPLPEGKTCLTVPDATPVGPIPGAMFHLSSPRVPSSIPHEHQSSRVPSFRFRYLGQGAASCVLSVIGVFVRSLLPPGPGVYSPSALMASASTSVPSLASVALCGPVCFTLLVSLAVVV